MTFAEKNNIRKFYGIAFTELNAIFMVYLIAFTALNAIFQAEELPFTAVNEVKEKKKGMSPGLHRSDIPFLDIIKDEMVFQIFFRWCKRP